MFHASSPVCLQRFSAGLGEELGGHAGHWSLPVLPSLQATRASGFTRVSLNMIRISRLALSPGFWRNASRRPEGPRALNTCCLLLALSHQDATPGPWALRAGSTTGSLGHERAFLLAEKVDRRGMGRRCAAVFVPLLQLHVLKPRPMWALS